METIAAATIAVRANPILADLESRSIGKVAAKLRRVVNRLVVFAARSTAKTTTANMHM